MILTLVVNLLFFVVVMAILVAIVWGILWCLSWLSDEYDLGWDDWVCERLEKYEKKFRGWTKRFAYKKEKDDEKEA